MMNFLSNSQYNVLKWITQILLPAVGTLYFALSDLWDLPSALEVVGTITAVVTFLGVVLGLSTNQYNKSDARFDGDISVDYTAAGKKLYSLNLDENDLDAMDQKPSVSFKIKKSNDS